MYIIWGTKKVPVSGFCSCLMMSIQMFKRNEVISNLQTPECASLFALSRHISFDIWALCYRLLSFSFIISTSFVSNSQSNVPIKSSICIKLLAPGIGMIPECSQDECDINLCSCFIASCQQCFLMLTCVSLCLICLSVLCLRTQWLNIP